MSRPDLKDNVWVNPDVVPANGVDDDRNGYVDDVNGWDFANKNASVFDAAGEDDHGTHVAGTIAARGNNGIGVVGIDRRAKVMPLKFIGSSGYGDLSDAAAALNYAVAEGAKISNNSHGCAGCFSQTLLDAIRGADARGPLFVAAGQQRGGHRREPPLPRVLQLPEHRLRGGHRQPGRLVELLELRRHLGGPRRPGQVHLQHAAAELLRVVLRHLDVRHCRRGRGDPSTPTGARSWSSPPACPACGRW